MKDGELVLVDAGAEAGGYTADVSRTFPVSGKFTAPQREMYEVVLEAQRVCIAAAGPGTSLHALRRLALQTLHARLATVVGVVSMFFCCYCDGVVINFQ